MKLFHRYPRPIRLTTQGAALYPVLCECFDRMSSGLAQSSQPDPDRPLSVSVTVAFASLWLIRRLPALRSQTGLNLKVEADNRPVDLTASDVDFAVRYAIRAELKDQWQPLFDDRRVQLCAPELLRRNPVDDDAGVRSLPLIEYRWTGARKRRRADSAGPKQPDVDRRCPWSHSTFPRKSMPSTRRSWPGRGSCFQRLARLRGCSRARRYLPAIDRQANTCVMSSP